MRFVLAVAIVLLPTVLFAQANDLCVGTECYTPTADEISAFQIARDNHNDRLCASVDLSSGCSQVDFDNAGGTGTIYASTAAGTREYALEEMFKKRIADFVRSQLRAAKARANAAWDAATPAQRAAACAELPGCN